MLRCMMMGACNSCGGPSAADNNRDRQVVGTSDSYAYRADFPPSYSTGKVFLTGLFLFKFNQIRTSILVVYVG